MNKSPLDRRTKRSATLPAARRRHRAPSHAQPVPNTGENSLAADETLADVESELGQNAWIDPETGGLAEGESPPHVDEE